jgi:hypothetical protein
MNDPLMHKPFSYQCLKNESVQIFHKGKLATTLSTTAAHKFMARIERLDEAEQQQLMARVTGQFKFGNERVATQKSR